VKEVHDKPISEVHGGCNVSGWTNDPTACGIFCNWADDAGITMVSDSSWKHVAQNELEHHEQNYKGHSPEQLKEGQTRWRENSNGFQNFRALPHGSLGDYLEAGAGMYTQLWNLLKLRPDAQPSSITLLEPNINRYLELEGCTFSDGKLNGQNVTLINDVLENFKRVDSFDTVLVVNVVEHVIDSSRFLSAVHRALRPGGLLIWGERYFEDPDEESARVLGSTILHPIRLTPEYIDHFLSHFDPIYSASFDTPQSRERNFGEQGYFYMGRKRAHAA
jgi:SAM-dependent methyltransferase